MTTKKTTTAKKAATTEKKATTAKKTTTTALPKASPKGQKAAPAKKAATAIAEPTLEIVAPTGKEKLTATAIMPETPATEVAMEAVVAKAEIKTEAPKAEEKTAPVAEKKIVLTIGMLQKRLSELGLYDAPWDGVYGPMTKHAMARFQAKNGLAVNGDANPATLAALGLNLFKTY